MELLPTRRMRRRRTLALNGRANRMAPVRSVVRISGDGGRFKFKAASKLQRQDAP